MGTGVAVPAAVELSGDEARRLALCAQGFERLLAIGTVVCVERTTWRRVYDLVERAIPARRH